MQWKRAILIIKESATSAADSGKIKFFFGNPANKAWTLNLYNAVNETGYSDTEAVEPAAVENAVNMGMKNDASFLFSEFESVRSAPMYKDLYIGAVFAAVIILPDNIC